MTTRIQVAELFTSLVADTTDFAKGLASTTKDARGWAAGMGKTIAKAGLAVVASGAALAAGAVLGLGAAIGKMTLDAAAVQGTVNTFNKLVQSVGGDAVKAMEMLRGATRGMVGDADLMAASNKFLAMGVAETAEEAAQLAEVSTQLGMAMGEDATASMENFALMMANQSIPRLDSFGISSGAVRTRIAELMETTKDMTREEAFKIAVMEQSAITMGKVGEQSDTVAGTMGRIKTTIANTTLGIGQAFLPVLQELLTPLADIAQDVGPQLIEWAQVAAKWLGEKLPVAIKMLRDWWEDTLLPALARLRDLWTGTIQPALEKMWAWLQVKIPEAIETLRGFWEDTLLPALEKIKEFWESSVRPALEGLWKWLKVKVPIAIETLRAFWEDTLLPALETIQEVWESTVKPTLVEIIKGISDFVKDAIEFIKNMTVKIRATIEKWMAVLQQWWTKHGDSVMTIVNFLWDGIKLIFDTVSAVVGGILTAATKLWQSLWSSHGSETTSLITTLWEGIKKIFSAAFEALGLILDAFAAAIEGDWKLFGEHLRKAWDTVWEAIKEALRNAGAKLMELVASLVQSVKEKFTSVDWGKVGRAIIEGIKSGIEAAAQWLIDAAVAAAQNALEAVKGWLGIESPSRAFALVGRQMMEGMALGISGTAHVPAMAAVGASTQVLDRSRHETWSITANYAYQSERTLRDDIRMRQLLAGV